MILVDRLRGKLGPHRLGWLRALAYAALWLFSPRTVRLVRVGQGRLMAIVPHDRGIGFPLWIGHGLEPATSALLPSLVRRGEVVFDVGANAGYFTLLLSELVGEAGTVVAFEPVGAQAALLRRSIELNRLRNVTVCENAVADGDGELALTLDRVNSGLASLSPRNVLAPGGTVRVRGLTLDGYSRVTGLYPGLLKIDVQGAEMKVLRGAAGQLDRDVRIILEYWPRGIRHLGDDPSGLYGLLREHGFEVCRIEEDSRVSALDAAAFARLTSELSAGKNPLRSANLLASKP